MYQKFWTTGMKFVGNFFSTKSLSISGTTITLTSLKSLTWIIQEVLKFGFFLLNVFIFSYFHFWLRNSSTKQCSFSWYKLFYYTFWLKYLLMTLDLYKNKMAFLHYLLPSDPSLQVYFSYRTSLKVINAMYKVLFVKILIPTLFLLVVKSDFNVPLFNSYS